MSDNLSNNVPSNLVPSTKYSVSDNDTESANAPVTVVELPDWPDGITPSQERFLTAYSLGGSVSAAARACKTSRANPYRWAEASPAFREALTVAKEYGVQRLEDWALSRAMDTMNPSDRLTEFLLKASRPEVYRERVDHRLTGQIEHRKRVILESIDGHTVVRPDDEDE